MLVRTIQYRDLASLLALARSTGVGVTTLPANEERLATRIDVSVKGIADQLSHGDANYVFVLEDDQTGEVVGISGIAGAVGLDEPWYNYRVGLSVHASRELGVYRQMPTLFLTNDLTGHAELCSLFLDADYRLGSNGCLLSKSRLLFLAEFPERFGAKVIAEMRGVSDDAGCSPFWESLGRHFFRMDFGDADYLSGVGNKSFIAELMPQHPVYIDFLTPQARAVIGKVHQNTEPALALLQSEGFQYQGYVDIFDAGPTVECPLSGIRAVRHSQVLQAVSGEEPESGRQYMVSNRRLNDFRVCLVQGEPVNGEFILGAASMRRLDVQPGDEVRAVPLSSKEK